MEKLPIITAIVGIISLYFAKKKEKEIMLMDVGTSKMYEISIAIKEGAIAFLKREYKILTFFVLIITLILSILNLDSPILMLQAFSFLVGSICSGLSGIFGMNIATSANVRTTKAAQEGISKALYVALSGGAVMGMSVVGLAALGLSLLFILYINIPSLYCFNDMTNVLIVLSGFSMGASSIALFARVGGGIFTKAADIGADLVGKVEVGIPEDDPRNPAVIADLVGDNVGDVAGMGADLFESYVGAIISSMIIGSTLSISNITADGIILVEKTMIYMYLPFAIISIGIISSILGILFICNLKNMDIQTTLNIGTYSAGFLTIISSIFAINVLTPEYFSMGGIDKIFSRVGISISLCIGVLTGISIGLITEYFCSKGNKPVNSIVSFASTGAATTIIKGLSVGMASTSLPIIIISSATIISNYFAGIYGIVIAAIGMLSTIGIQLAIDAYGPIADNAGGIAEMAGLSSEIRERTDKLDAIGNTTAAIGKGFAIGSAALTAFALFSAYQTQLVKFENRSFDHLFIDLGKAHVMAGLLIGAMLPFLFSSLAMDAVGRAAGDMIKEVRRQFKENPGIMLNQSRAEYAKCVDISTKAALREMILPGCMAIFFPIVIGFIDGTGLMLGGLLAGSIATGVLMALFMSNSGGAWDNAKKQIEEEIISLDNNTGKGSLRHEAVVIGDTVGDPFKDTAGPSLNILIKLMTIVALIIVPFISKYGIHLF